MHLTDRNDDVLSCLFSVGVWVALHSALLPVDNLAGQNGLKMCLTTNF